MVPSYARSESSLINVYLERVRHNKPEAFKLQTVSVQYSDNQFDREKLPAVECSQSDPISLLRR